GLFSEAVQSYVNEFDTNTIAHDVSRHQRIHHPLALPSPENYSIPLLTTSMSTVTSLLDDAFKHLSTLAPPDTIVATLEDKYSDIWEEIETAKAAENKIRLRKAFCGWNKRANTLHIVSKLSKQACRKRMIRLFYGWRDRIRLLRQVDHKFQRVWRRFVAITFKLLMHYADTSHQVTRMHRKAKRSKLSELLWRWRQWATRKHFIANQVRKARRKRLRKIFTHWRSRIPVWRQTKRTLFKIARPLNRAFLQCQFNQWKMNHRQIELDIKEAKRQSALRIYRLERCFKAWKRYLMLHYRIARAIRRRQIVSVQESMVKWQQYWRSRRSLRPNTWTCDLVGIWLATLFHLPIEVAASCQVNGNELLQLASRLQIDLHQPSSWASTSLERLLPQMPLFFCSSNHRMVLLEAITALANPLTSKAARETLAQQRNAQITMIMDFASLRHFFAQDRELLAYVRRLDHLSLEMFINLSTEELVDTFQPQKDSHLALLVVCQQQLQKNRIKSSSPPKEVPQSQDMDVAAWLESIHLAQYIPRFFQAHINTREELAKLDHLALRDRLYIHSKLHRERLLNYITELRHQPHAQNTTQIPLKKPHVPMAASFRLKMALNHIDDTTSVKTTTTKAPTTAKLQKHIRSLFFTIARALEEREWTLEHLFLSLQSSSGNVTTSKFAQWLREWNCGFTSAQINAMWEAMALRETRKNGVNYTTFMAFFINVFEQRYQLLTVAIQTLQDQAEKSEKQREQLTQLLQSVGRTRRILTLAGVYMNHR
ncbi:hypothetical protein THRCLA_22600, partial [Thraustotheca clavata]